MVGVELQEMEKVGLDLRGRKEEDEQHYFLFLGGFLDFIFLFFLGFERRIEEA